MSSYTSTYLMLIRYWARATDSAFPVMVMVRSRLAGASRSSQLEIRIMAPESCLQWSDCNKYVLSSHLSAPHLISATLDPPLPMMQPMSSLGTVISWVCCWAAWLRAWPVSRARAETEDFKTFYFPRQPASPSSSPTRDKNGWKIPYFSPPPLHSVTDYWVLNTENLARYLCSPHLITCWIDHPVGERIDSVDNINRQPNLSQLKHLGYFFIMVYINNIY